MKVDRPIPAKIILTLSDNKATGEEFIALSGSLYQNNLTYPEPRELRRNKNILELSVIFRDESSYKNWMKNSHIVKYWAAKFQEQLIGKPKTIKEIDIIIESDNRKNCSCNTADFYILQGRSLLFIDELTCSSCLSQISYSRVPLDIEIENWQTHYQRVYLNWLESSFFEKAAYKELTNYKKGKLNVEGEKIRKQLAEFFKIPVYISYFVDEPDVNHPCLICKQPGTDSGLKRPNRICKTCNTIFGYDVI
jgi:Zn-ribbon-containing, possibly nucleic-acid-binding protein (DUF2310)